MTLRATPFDGSHSRRAREGFDARKGRSEETGVDSDSRAGHLDGCRSQRMDRVVVMRGVGNTNEWAPNGNGDRPRCRQTNRLPTDECAAGLRRRRRIYFAQGGALADERRRAAPEWTVSYWTILDALIRVAPDDSVGLLSGRNVRLR